MDLNENNNVIEENNIEPETPTEEASFSEGTVLVQEGSPETEIISETDSVQDLPIENTVQIKKISMKPFIIVAVVAVVFVAGFFVVKNLVVPSVNYNKAISLRENKQFDEAVGIFKNLADFKDSKKQIDITLEEKEKHNTNLIIEETKKLYDSGERVEAYRLLKTAKNKEMTQKLLDEYEQGMLDSVKDDYDIGIGVDNSDFRKYSPRYTGDSYDIGCSYGKASVIFYCFDTQETDYHFTVAMRVVFYAALDNPIRPQTITFANSQSSVEIAVGYFDRDITYDYYILEDITTSISLDEFNRIIEIFEDEEDFDVTIKGHAASKDFKVKEKCVELAINSSDFINALYESHYRDILISDKINESTTYEEAVGVMVEIIDTIDSEGLTQVLVDDMKFTYSKISQMETSDKELQKQVNIVYNMFCNYYDYCLDPYIEKGESGMISVDEIYIATFESTTFHLASPQLATLKNML